MNALQRFGMLSFSPRRSVIRTEHTRPWYVAAIGALALCALGSCASKRTDPVTKIRHVVLVSIDTCRADHLGCYGYKRNTSPEIDSIAGAGVLFARAVSPIPLTLPSHSTMMTGKAPPFHRVRDNNSYRLGKQHITLAQILRRDGFKTAAFVGSAVLNSQFGLSRGFDTYDDVTSPTDSNGFLSYAERNAEEVTDLAIRWLQDNDGNRVFLFAHYFDPHSSYRSHPDFTFTREEAAESITDRYDSEIAFTDHHIGRLARSLEVLGIADSTLMIITADHGEGLGAHEEQTHGFMIYDSTLHVPLIFRGPGIPSGRRSSQSTGLADILPTVTGLLGLPVPEDIQGTDLTPWMTEAAPPDDHPPLLCESLLSTKFDLPPLFGLYRDNWHYIHAQTPELYDLRNDPAENRNVATQRSNLVSRMRSDLEVSLMKASIVSPASEEITLGDPERLLLESLGYLAGRSVTESTLPTEGGPDLTTYGPLVNSVQYILTLTGAGNHAQARQIIEDLIAHYPAMPELYYRSGQIAVKEGNATIAVRDFSRYLNLAIDEEGNYRGIRRDEEVASAHVCLADAYLEKNQHPQAVAHYGQALKLRPNVPRTLNRLAWLLATAEDATPANHREAVRLARLACEQTESGNPDFMDTLSVALAAVGDFSQAHAVASRALNLAFDLNRTDLEQVLESRQAFFKTKTPIREDHRISRRSASPEEQ